MSRLTASPFHRPSAFSFPKAPLSPPESDHVGSSGFPTNVSVAGGYRNMVDSHRQDDSVPSVAGTETPGARFRRVSSLAYNSSGLRESRERRTHKLFVVVVPPPTFLQDHGQLGHTLAVGPAHRLSQGLLVPLFPTMYGQLTAIAKEFSFPSTTGICLYLQSNVNGVTVSPRISDESWQFLWAHVFDSPSPVPQGPPICGKIEFDIDFRHARWYSSWLASAHHREHVDIPTSLDPSHYRAESRTTAFPDEDGLYDSPPLPPLPSAATTTRHVPKTLSLVDRLDTMSLRSLPRAPLARGASPPSQTENTARPLSTVFQEEEPATARLDNLERRVNTWRATSTVPPTSLAAKGQISLEPANMPNSISLEDQRALMLDVSVDDEVLNLEDYTWSISSAGPGDYEPVSPSVWNGVRSIHMANRMEASVCLTPSDCTSFGPSDYTLPSPFLAELMHREERVRSPDLADRMYEDVPPTPSTMTSWGPASFEGDMRSEEEYARSIDLGDRLVFSRPATPSTATSWGPADSWPPSPTFSSRPPSVHLGERGEFSRPATPSTATSWGAPLSYPPSPVESFRPLTPGTGARGFLESEDILEPNRSVPWRHAWLYSEIHEQSSTPWPHVWPYVPSATTEGVPSAPTVYQPWGQVWPYNRAIGKHIPTSTPPSRLVPVTSTAEFAMAPRRSLPWKLVWPYRSQQSSLNYRGRHLQPWKQVWPYRLRQLPQAQEPARIQPWKQVWPYRRHQSSARQRLLQPWNQVWPYRRHQSSARQRHLPPWNQVWPYRRHQSSPSSRQRHLQPWNQVWPYRRCYSSPNDRQVHLRPWKHVWPYKELSSAPQIRSGKALASTAYSYYPYFCIYPSCYPHFDLYPAVACSAVKPGSRPRRVPSDYPYFNIYPACYPNFNLYPAPAAKATDPPGASRRSVYPRFDIYAVMYPHFNLYPDTAATMKQSHEAGLSGDRHRLRRTGAPAIMHITTKLPNLYPVLNIYPACYPGNLKEIYPAKCLKPRAGPSETVSRQYPYFRLYDLMFPHFDLYPAPAGRVKERSVDEYNNSQYNHFSLHPPKKEFPERHGLPYHNDYPWNLKELYPIVSSSSRERTPSQHVRYPFLQLYPAAYPYFDLYPAMSGGSAVRQSLSYGNYPYLQIYAPVYPYLTPYPTIMGQRSPLKRVPTSYGSYPSLQIYAPVYPNLILYPPVAGASAASPERSVVGSHGSYPFFQLYKPVYPFNLQVIYTPVSGGREPVLRRRRTHAELHAISMTQICSAEQSTPLPTHKIRVQRPHHDLHVSVFPDGAVCTPSGTPVPNPTPPPVASRSTTRARSGSILRSPTAMGPLPPVPSGPRPSPSRLSMRPQTAPIVTLEDALMSPPKPSSFRRSLSSATSPSGKLSPQVSRLSPLTERPGLHRASSLALPTRNGASPDEERSHSASLSAGHRKRDSLVLQRIKHFNATADEEQSRGPSLHRSTSSISRSKVLNGV